VKTRTKHPTDITVGANPKGVAVTPDSKTAFVTNANYGNEQEGPIGDSVSTIDVKTRTKHPTDIPVGAPDRGGNHAGRQDGLRRQLGRQHGVDD
jgi:DNA-binding beta-propeller fold protein YncE